MAKAINVPDVSPRNMLVSWANEQDGWVRDAVGQILTYVRPLADAQLRNLHKRYLTEKGLVPGESSDVPALESSDETTGQEDVLLLNRLGSVANVNALAANQEILFDPSLTVLFGQNGAGKTGYARILKRLAAVRTAEEILPDARNPATPNASPEAIVEFALNGVDDILMWKNEAGVQPFTRMSVFDSPAVNLHVDNELNYVFTPSELALFTYVSDSIRYVQHELETESANLRTVGNPFLQHFRRGTQIFPLIEALGPTTDIAGLAAAVDATDDGETRVQNLTTEVAALRSGGVEARYDAVKQELDRVELFLRMTTALIGFDEGRYSDNRETFERLNNEHRAARAQLFADGDLPGPADDEWTEFVTQADHYREHLGLEHYPTDGDRCLYCMQELAPAAVALVTKYRTFLDDVLARSVATARQTFDRSRLSLGGLSLDVLSDQSRQAAELDHPPAYVNSVVAVVDLLRAVKHASDVGGALPAGELTSQARSIVPALMTARESLTSSLKDLEQQKVDRSATLEAKDRELADLVARRSLGRHFAAIETFVANAKRRHVLDALAKSMSSSMLRPLTMLATAASTDLVNRNFERLFVEECAALRAPLVALEFQGRRGQAERKKAVANHRPSAILSEGEQKVLALADFLAESRMSGVTAPIIFDDPVTSLDYLRLNEVAQRVSLLAETHQVIVFTHNIFFASTLLGLRTTKKLKCKFYEIKEAEVDKGIVMADVEPRQDTPAEIGKKINELVQTAGSAESVVQAALVERGYGLLRSWTEAFVEQELLQNVTQRFRFNVMMGGLEKIKLDRFENAVKEIIPTFDRCSRFMPGHSQPVEQLNVQPSLGDLKADWAKMQAVRKAYITN